MVPDRRNGIYRSVLTALGLALLWGEAPRAQGISSPSPTPKEQPGKGTGHSDRQPNPLAVTIVERPEQANASERREAESRKHDARDLDAQIRAAKAAEEQVSPAWLAAILSFIGTILIVWTLCLTRQANKIARDTANRQLRAYVGASIEEPFFGRDGRLARIRLNIFNSGATPAYRCRHFGDVTFMTEPEMEAFLQGESEKTARGRTLDVTLQPGRDLDGDMRPSEDHHHLRFDTIPLFIGGDRKIFAYGWVCYDDAFGTPRETCFCYWMQEIEFPPQVPGPLDEIEGRVTWTMTPFHNTST